MKQFLSFVRKEFKHIFRDRTTIAILLLLPILMLILFGYAITTEVKNTKIAVYDPSKDATTKAIIEKLQSSEYFTLFQMLNNQADVDEIFKEGKIGMVVIFSEKFYENMMHTGTAQIQLITDGTDPNSSTTLTGYATRIISAYQQELIHAGGVPYQIYPEVKLLYNPEMKGAYNYVPGVMGMIMMLICAMMTSIAIAREKESGTMEILLVSPMKPIYIILSKAVPYLFLSLVNLTTILLLSVFVLKVPIAGSIFWLIVISLAFIFVCLALGLLISSLVSTQLVALLISGMALIIPVIMLSGMIFPVENMPAVLQWISQIVPAKWYIIAVKNIMIKGLGFMAIAKELIILGIMAAVLIIISLKNFKYRLE
jgi:ABC-2 type transport system permease protein